MPDSGSLVRMMTTAGSKDAVALAREIASRAHAPYSGFRVGAVLEDRRENLYGGCNVECASIGLSLCAERGALAIALSRGAGPFKRLWIYTPTEEPTRPCGACREMLLRCAGDMEVVLVCDGGSSVRTRLSRLLPRLGMRGGGRS
jgi:cytidine deaminase